MDRLNGNRVDLEDSMVSLEQDRLRVPSAMVTDPRYLRMFESDEGINKLGMFFRFNASGYSAVYSMKGMMATMKEDSDMVRMTVRNDNRLSAEQIVELERIIVAIAGCPVKCGYEPTSVMAALFCFSVGILIVGLFSRLEFMRMIWGGLGAGIMLMLMLMLMLMGVGCLAVRAVSRCVVHSRMGELPPNDVLPNDFPSGFRRVAVRLDFPEVEGRVIGVFPRGILL
jgi:hypothetical protein